MTFAHSRVFAATPAQVFAAFKNPARLATWWGPDGFRNTFGAFEFVPGGRWQFTMHGPDGKDYANEALFTTIEPDRAVVIEHTSQPHFTLAIRLHSEGAGTRVTWDQTFTSAETAAAIKHIVEPANEQNLTRWQTEVAAG